MKKENLLIKHKAIFEKQSILDVELSHGYKVRIERTRVVSNKTSWFPSHVICIYMWLNGNQHFSRSILTNPANLHSHVDLFLSNLY